MISACSRTPARVIVVLDQHDADQRRAIVFGNPLCRDQVVPDIPAWKTVAVHEITRTPQIALQIQLLIDRCRVYKTVSNDRSGSVSGYGAPAAREPQLVQLTALHQSKCPITRIRVRHERR